MALSNPGENIFIGYSAATSHMTSNKLGVYNLITINGSVMIGNEQSISCTHKVQSFDKERKGISNSLQYLSY